MIVWFEAGRQLAAFHGLKFRPLGLDSEASHTADLRCGIISHQPWANMSLAAFKSKLKTYLFSRSSFTVTHDGHPALLWRFSW